MKVTKDFHNLVYWLKYSSVLIYLRPKSINFAYSSMLVKKKKATSTNSIQEYVLNLWVDIVQSFYQKWKLKFAIDYEIPDKC